MKKMLYLTFIGLFVSSLTFAQSNKAEAVSRTHAKQAFNTKTTKTSQAKDFENPLWEDDFSDPAVWEIGNEVGNDDDWVIGTEVPSGAFAIAGIESTTAENGFALFDSDLLCSGNQDAWIQNAEPIDLSGSGIVAVRFETYYRNFQGSCFVESSTDGENWDNSVELFTEVAVNDATDNPAVVTQVLTGIGNSSTAYFRFRYQGGCDYAWMVDDVKIAAAPENDLEMVEAYYDKYVDFLDLEAFADVDYLIETELSEYHKDQVRPLSFIANVQNLGTSIQTGVELTVEVTDPDGEVSFYTSEPIDIESETTGVVRVDDVMLDAFNGGTNAVVGDYDISYSISWDQQEDDDSGAGTLTRSFRVSEDVMANDFDTEWTNYYPTIGEDVIWAQRYMFEQEDEVNYISFGVLGYNTAADPEDNAESIPGSIMYLNMRSGSVLEAVADTNVMNRYFGASEISYVVAEDDLTRSDTVIWVNIPLPEPVAVSPGVVYQGEVEIPLGFEGPYAWIPFSNEASEYTMNYLQLNPDDQSGGPQGWWTSLTLRAHIRLGMDMPTSTNDSPALNFKVGQNYPNPTTGATRIDWELLEPAENVQFRISDINGRTVFQKDLGDRPAGVQETMELNLNHLAAGNYQYALQIGNQIIVRKMVITK